MARPKKNSQPIQPIAHPPIEDIATESGNDLAAILSNLIQGEEPTNKKERIILSKWNHLTRWERRALAALWDLPGEQEANERLARQAEGKLNRL